MSNTSELYNIFFWITFVGYTLFLVRGIYASVLLRTQKIKEYTQSEIGITMMAATLSILFAILAISHKNEIENHVEHINNTPIELYEEIGTAILYDSTDNIPDTINLFILKK